MTFICSSITGILRAKLLCSATRASSCSSLYAVSFALTSMPQSDPPSVPIRDESLPGFHALNCVLVDIQPVDLEPVSKLSLGYPEILADLRDLYADDVVSAVGRTICKHGVHFLFDTSSG